MSLDASVAPETRQFLIEEFRLFAWLEEISKAHAVEEPPKPEEYPFNLFDLLASGAHICKVINLVFPDFNKYKPQPRLTIHKVQNIRAMYAEVADRLGLPLHEIVRATDYNKPANYPLAVHATFELARALAAASAARLPAVPRGSPFETAAAARIPDYAQTIQAPDAAALAMTFAPEEDAEAASEVAPAAEPAPEAEPEAPPAPETPPAREAEAEAEAEASSEPEAPPVPESSSDEILISSKESSTSDDELDASSSDAPPPAVASASASSSALLGASSVDSDALFASSASDPSELAPSEEASDAAPAPQPEAAPAPEASEEASDSSVASDDLDGEIEQLTENVAFVKRAITQIAQMAAPWTEIQALANVPERAVADESSRALAEEVARLSDTYAELKGAGRKLSAEVKRNRAEIDALRAAYGDKTEGLGYGIPVSVFAARPRVPTQGGAAEHPKTHSAAWLRTQNANLLRQNASLVAQLEGKEATTSLPDFLRTTTKNAAGVSPVMNSEQRLRALRAELDGVKARQEQAAKETAAARERAVRAMYRHKELRHALAAEIEKTNALEEEEAVFKAEYAGLQKSVDDLKERVRTPVSARRPRAAASPKAAEDGARFARVDSLESETFRLREELGASIRRRQALEEELAAARDAHSP